MRIKNAFGLDQKVSELCLGSGQYGSELSEDASFKLLDHFAQAGGNFIDTAHIYGAWDCNGTNGGCGNSEAVIGRWMRMRNCREKMVIGTKGGHPDFTTGASSLTRETLLQQLHESLDHLQTDHIDIYWLHRDERTIPEDIILRWLQEPLKQGLIRSIGTSHWCTDRMTSQMISANQIGWSLARPAEQVTVNLYGEMLTMDNQTFVFHKESQIPVVAFNAQAGGFFAAIYNDESFFKKSALYRQFGSELNMKNRRTACELAEEKGCSANQIALAWLLHQPFPVFPLIGPRTVKQLDDSLGSFSVILDEEELSRFDFKL